MAFHSSAPAITDVHVPAGRDAAPLVAAGAHVRITAAEGAHGVVVLGEPAPTTMDVQLAPGSSVQIVGLWGEGDAQAQATLAAGAHLHWHIARVGGAGALTVVSTLQGDDARCDVDAVLIAGDGDTPKLTVTNAYQGKRGGGDLAMRAIAAGKSRAQCSGTIRIAEHGSGTDTYLAQRVLLLGGAATVDAIPALEIRTNDVKASHGATVTRVTPLDLFSFAARGIAPEEAKQLFVEGFLLASLARSPDGTWRDRVRAMADAKILGAARS